MTNATEQLKPPGATRWYGRLCDVLRTYFSPAWILIGFVASSGIVGFALDHPELAISIVAMALWCSHIAALALLQQHSGAEFVAGVAQHVRRLFMRGLLVNLLLSIVLGLSAGWSATAIAIHACVLCAIGTLVCLAPPIASILAISTLHVVWIVALPDYDPAQWRRGAPPYDSIWMPLLFASVAMTIPAWLTWLYRSKLASKGRPWWATSAFVLLDRVMQRSRQSRKWWNDSDDLFTRVMMPKFLRPGANSPVTVVRCLLGIPFVSSAMGATMFVLLIVAGYCMQVVLDANSPPMGEPPDSSPGMRVIVFAACFMPVLQRLYGFCRNGAELAELHLFPGLGTGRRMQAIFLQGTLGHALRVFAFLAVLMLGSASLILLYYGRQAWIASYIGSCATAIAVWVSAFVLLFFLMLNGYRRHVIYALVIVPAYVLSIVFTGALPHLALSLVFLLMALMLYRRWVRLPHPFLLR